MFLARPGSPSSSSRCSSAGTRPTVVGDECAPTDASGGRPRQTRPRTRRTRAKRHDYADQLIPRRGSRRRRPRTLTIAKAMLDVAGRPGLVHWQLENRVLCRRRRPLHQRFPRRANLRARWVTAPATAFASAIRGARASSARPCPLRPRVSSRTYGDSYLPFDYAEPLCPREPTTPTA